MGELRTDYLVVGAGAAGMAFTDTLLTHGDADTDVVVVDRRHRPGGHWNDAYPFVRLHQPSAYYGVESRPLGADRVDGDGPNAGFYERATGAEICEYFVRVLEERLLPSGRVRFLPGCEYETADDGAHVVRGLGGGDRHTVSVARGVVDATYLETAVPATHTRSFAVDEGVRLVPVHELPGSLGTASAWVLLGGGKTAMDACAWLLDAGVDPDRIRWVRPRDSWLLDRAGWQPLDQVASIFGRVVRIALDRIELERGTIPTDPDQVHVDCTAAGLRLAPARPVFELGRITLQQVRQCSPTFNAAFIAFVEATRRGDLAAQNRLCPPTPYPDAPRDWVPTFLTSLVATNAWLAEPDIAEWLEGLRVNLLRGLRLHSDEARMQDAVQRYFTHLQPAISRLQQFVDEAAAPTPS